MPTQLKERPQPSKFRTGYSRGCGRWTGSGGRLAPLHELAFRSERVRLATQDVAGLRAVGGRKRMAAGEMVGRPR